MLHAFCKFFPISDLMNRQCPQIARGPGLATNAAQRIGPVFLRIFVDNGAMASEFELYFYRRFSFHGDELSFDLHLTPPVTRPISVWILRVGLFDIHILLVNSENGDSPGNMLIVTGGNTGQSRLSRT